MIESDMIEIYVSDVLFMYKFLGKDMPTGFQMISAEEEAALRAEFDAALPTPAKLREYATMIRDFTPVEMSWNEVDQAANDMCNMHFDMFVEGHQEWTDMHIGYVVAHREMTQEWVGKYNQWINTPRSDVEAKFDEYS